MDNDPNDDVRHVEVMSSGPGPGGPRITDWREETPGEDELGRAAPNFPLDRDGVPDGTQSDAEGAYSQNPE